MRQEPEVTQYRGTLSLFAPFVDATARRYADKARNAHDESDLHHVVLVTANEVESLRSSGRLSPALTKLQSAVAGPLAHLGVRHEMHDDVESCHVLVSCPGVQRVRKELGLGKKDLRISPGVVMWATDCDEPSRSTLHWAEGLPAEAHLATDEIEALLREHATDVDICDILVRETSKRAELAGTRYEVRARLARARCAGRDKQFATAASDAAIAAALAPKNPHAHLTHGDALRCLEGKEPEAAFEAYAAAMRLVSSATTQKQRELRATLLGRMTALEVAPPPPPKFPRTQHVVNLGGATRDDLLFPAHLRESFVAAGSAASITIEEKIDGANLGLFVNGDWQIVAQNRSHSVCSETAPQWASLDRWLQPRKVQLCKALGQRYAVYGEWMFAKHSIHYTRLPDVFVAFDVYDRVAQAFLSVQARDRVLARAKLVPIRRVQSGGFTSALALENELRALLEGAQSAYYDGPVEGLVLRRDETRLEGVRGPTYLQDRAKIVRASFSQAIETHWTRNTLVRNGIVPHALPNENRDGLQAAGTQKYPSTPHLPFSPSVQSDDTQLQSSDFFCGKRIIITEKLDGGNCCLAPGGVVYARTHAQEATHWSFGAVKQLYARLQAQFPDVLDQEAELYGENMSAVHSIAYDRLTSPFYLFGVKVRGAWLAWDEVAALARALEIPTVPLVFDGTVANEAQLRALLEMEAGLPSRVATDITGEGFVVRVAEGFDPKPTAFERSIAKFVRAGHVQTEANWKNTCSKAKICYGQELGMRAPVSSHPVQLYVDLDGVLADFVAGVVRLCGRGPEQMAASAMWRAIGGDRDFFGSLEWMPGAQALWEDSLASLRPTILSGVPMSSTRWAQRQKTSWCERHLGSEVPRIFCATREKARYSGPGRVLIDDRELARKPWEAAGGIFILYRTPKQVACELRDLLARLASSEDKKSAGSEPGTGASSAGQEAGSSKTAARPALRKCSYRLVLLVGLPGSGKSTFAKAFAARYRCEYISQDELGSRRKCEDWVGRHAKSGYTVVLDRCNVEKADRKYWIELSMAPSKRIAIVYFAPPENPAELANRLVERQGHPTIQTSSAQSAQRIVDSFGHKLEVPRAEEDKVGRVFTISDFTEAAAVLNALGAPKP